MVNPLELLMAQHENGEFKRYDLILRYLAGMGIIDGTGAYKSEYKKMLNRVKPGLGDERYSRFPGLIKNMATGYDENYPIPVKSNYRLIEGSHRLVIAIIYGFEAVPVAVKESGGRDYDRGRMLRIGFTNEFVDMLDGVKKNLGGAR